MILRIITLSIILPLISAYCGPDAPSGTDYVHLGIEEGVLTNEMDSVNDTTLSLSHYVNGSCDIDCLFSLQYYIPPHQHSFLIVRKEMNEFVPYGYNQSLNHSIIYCSRYRGNCGATVPLWRHFTLNFTGIYHKYTIDDSKIDGYIRESVPLCWFWNSDLIEEEGSGEDVQVKRDKRDTSLLNDIQSCEKNNASTKMMNNLIEYSNGKTGSLLDHFYTIQSNDSSELNGYTPIGVLGQILTGDDKSCGCLITLVQTFDNQTGIFNRIDHKLMRDDAELNRIFEKYSYTGEKFYCVENSGQCGATIPLYKHFDYIHIDTTLTTSKEKVPTLSYRYPTTPICYIWNMSYVGNDAHPTTRNTEESTKSTPITTQALNTSTDEMTEEMTTQLAEETTIGVTEDMTSLMTEEMTDIMTTQATEDMTEVTDEKTTEETEEMSEVTEETTNQMTEEMTSGMTDEITDVTEGVTEETYSTTSGVTDETTDETTSEVTEEVTSGETDQTISEFEMTEGSATDELTEATTNEMETTVERSKRSTEYEEETTIDDIQYTTNETMESSTVYEWSTVDDEEVTVDENTTSSTRRTTTTTLPSNTSSLEELIIRLMRAALDNANGEMVSNWREIIKAQLRQLADKI